MSTQEEKNKLYNDVNKAYAIIIDAAYKSEGGELIIKSLKSERHRECERIDKITISKPKFTKITSVMIVGSVRNSALYLKLNTDWVQISPERFINGNEVVILTSDVDKIRGMRDIVNIYYDYSIYSLSTAKSTYFNKLISVHPLPLIYVPENKKRVICVHSVGLKVSRCIEKITGTKPDITSNIHTLEMDSLDSVELLVELEMEFDIEINDIVFARCLTFISVTEFIFNIVKRESLECK